MYNAATISLTSQDLLQIRQVVEAVIDHNLEPIVGVLEALRNDTKDIYDMLAEINKNSVHVGASFQKLSVKEQIFQLNATLIDLEKKSIVLLCASAKPTEHHGFSRG